MTAPSPSFDTVNNSDNDNPQKQQDQEVKDSFHNNNSGLFARQLEVLAVAWHVFSIPLILATFLLCCSFPPLWPFILVYLVSILSIYFIYLDHVTL